MKSLKSFISKIKVFLPFIIFAGIIIFFGVLIKKVFTSYQTKIKETTGELQDIKERKELVEKIKSEQEVIRKLKQKLISGDVYSFMERISNLAQGSGTQIVYITPKVSRKYDLSRQERIVSAEVKLSIKSELKRILDFIERVETTLLAEILFLKINKTNEEGTILTCQMRIITQLVER